MKHFCVIVLLLCCIYKCSANSAFEKLKIAEGYFEKGAKYLALEQLNVISNKELNANPQLALQYYSLKANIHYSLVEMDNMISAIHNYKIICSTSFKSKAIYQSYCDALYCKYYNYKATRDSIFYYASESMRLLKANKCDANLIDVWFIYASFANSRRNVYDLTAPDLRPELSAVYADTAILFLKNSNNYSVAKHAGLIQLKASIFLDLTTEGSQKKLGKEISFKYYKQSTALFWQAIKLYKSISEKHPSVATNLSLIALEEFYFNDFEKALQHYNKAESMCCLFNLDYSINSTALYANILKWREWCISKQLAAPSEENLLARISELKKANCNWQFQLFEAAGNRNDIFSDTYGIHPNSAIVDNYFKLYSMCGKLDYLDSAYVYAESQKYYSIAQERAGITYQSTVFKAIINGWHLQIDSALVGLKKSCVINPLEIKKINKLIQSNSNLNNTCLKDLQKSLKSNNQAIVYYFINPVQSNAKLQVISITKTNIRHLVLSTSRVMGESIQQYQSFLNALKRSDLAETKVYGYQMYKDYLKEVLDALPQGINQLVVFPAPLMQQYPLNALLTDSCGDSYKNLSYLVNKYVISYQLSGYTYIESKNSRNTNSLSLSLWKNTYASGNKNPIPHNENLSDELAKLYLFQKNDAANNTKAAFINAIQRSSVFHFSGHATTENTINSRTNLYLSNDSISIYDIYKLDLRNNQLCIFNACESGIGKTSKSEGQNDFARALTMQGSKAQILNKQKADDKASAFILSEFYKLISSGKSKSEALATAQRNYVRNSSIKEANPIYWCSLFVNGNDDALPIPKREAEMFSVNWLLIGIGILLLIFVLINRINKRKSRSV